MISEKIKIAEPVRGFTERDRNSKAILNTDMDSLLKYKIQKRKISDINKSRNEIALIRDEVDSIKSDLSEIKQLLLKITKEREE
jgi:hypothetical protein